SRRGKKANDSAHFFGRFDDIEALHHGSTIAWFKNCGQHSQRGGLACAVRAKQAVNLAWLGYKTDIVPCSNFTPLFIVEPFGQTASFNHRETSQKPFRILRPS